MTQPDLARLEGLLAKADTPWKLTPSVEWDHFGIYPATGKMEFPICLAPEFMRAEVVQDRFALIVAAVNSLPALLARVRELEKAATNSWFQLRHLQMFPENARNDATNELIAMLAALNKDTPDAG